MRCPSWLLLLVGGCLSCGTDDSSDQATHGNGGRGGSDFAPGGQGGSGDGNPELGGLGEDGTGLGRAGFRFGINLGHPNPDFGDAEMAELAAAVGATSIRLKYPEYHFDRWGASIEVADAEHYASLGMKDHVAFVIGMTQDHSTAPSGSSDWERDSYIPKALYEPIFDAAGHINPENYYAAYLATTFETYKPWVKYWEIFNEPDWVEDWQVTHTWDESPPGAEGELVRFHGTIFDYVRMLRIASTVRDVVAPGSFIMTGGLGYPGFLSAILRYTDNPDEGQVTEEYPKLGGDYFDVLSIHHYPHLVEDGNSDAALDSLRNSRDTFREVLEASGAGDKGFMMTENGAAHSVINGAASGPEYARNYLSKSLVWCKAEGFLGVDWFILSDGEDTNNPFEQMGLYRDVSHLGATSEATETDSGTAYLTTSQSLSQARLDIAATQSLPLPDAARGYVFATQGTRTYVLWANADSGEAATLMVSLPSTEPLVATTWDGDSGTALVPEKGSVSVTLTSSPLMLRQAAP